jgi:hypothetical protein
MASYVLESSEYESSGPILRAWVCSWCRRPSGLNHYPGLHQLISGFIKPTREADRVGFGFRSMATLECPNGKTFRPQIIDLWVIGIMSTVNTKKAFSPWSHRNIASPEIILFSPHWCILHAFWSISGLHPPKMGTFS